MTVGGAWGRTLLARIATLPWLPAALLCLGSAGWFALRCVHGIHFLSFGDESGHFVGARAIRAGDRLYRDFIDAHGPLSFMVAHLYGSLFGWREPLDARWAIAAIVMLAAIAVFTSPIFPNLAARFWGAALFLGLVAAPWLVQSLDMVNYHVLGGAGATVALAWLVVPALLGAPIAGWQAACAGLALALLCAAAYSLAPSAILFGASAVASRAGRRTDPTVRPLLRRALAGFAAGCLMILTWMLFFGDLVGYLVFHVISNQQNYARYTTYGIGAVLHALVPSLAPDRLVQSSAVLALAAAFVILLAWPARADTRARIARRIGAALLLAAMLMLNARGAAGFQNGSFLVASMALLALALPILMNRHCDLRSPTRAWFATLLLGLVLCGFEMAACSATASPSGATRAQYVAWPRSTLVVDRQNPIDRRIRQVLKPDERLLVLVYNPDFFLTAGFLPIRKFHEYLPWEADYARNPWFGRTRDLCQEVTARPPPIIIYDAWTVWGVYTPESFMACIPALLAKSYVADPIPFLYIRRDRVPAP